jgi:hypothetical protein
MLKYQVVIIHTARILYKRHGEFHRVDGPASLWEGGFLRWLQYDQQHRKDGPAVIYSDGEEVFWIRGIRTC